MEAQSLNHGVTKEAPASSPRKGRRKSHVSHAWGSSWKVTRSGISEPGALQSGWRQREEGTAPSSWSSLSILLWPNWPHARVTHLTYSSPCHLSPRGRRRHEPPSPALDRGRTLGLLQRVSILHQITWRDFKNRDAWASPKRFPFNWLVAVPRHWHA